MKHEDMRSLHGFRQVLEFLERAEVMRKEVDVAGHRRALQEVADQMAAAAARREVQWGEGRSLSTQRRTWRTKLEWDYLGLLRRLTRELVGEDASLAEVLRVPPKLRRVEELLAACRAIVAAMAAKPDVFAARGLGPEFVQGFTAAIAGMQSAVDSGGVVGAQRAGATAELRRLARRGRYLVAVLDATLRPVLAARSGLAREWAIARHQARWVSRKVGKPGLEDAVPGQAGREGAVPEPNGEVRAA